MKADAKQRLSNTQQPDSRLEPLGWSSRLEEAFRPWADEGCGVGRVVSVFSEVVRLYTAEGKTDAVLAGRLRRAAQEGAERPAVGDWVATRVGDKGGNLVVEAVLPRHSTFSRRAPGRPADEQVVAANVDVVWLVSALDRDFNPRRIERYLTLAYESGANPVIVLNKSDLADDTAEFVSRAEEVAPGVPIHVVSALQTRSLEPLRSYLNSGQTVALLGSSGVGKSTIVNALLGEERQSVADLASTGKGAHTTSRRELILLPGGGLLLDTPGMRELQLWTSEAGLSEAFADIEEIAADCRFRDCQHEQEPDCAVRAAVEDGSLGADRVESFQSLRDELTRLEAQRDAVARRRAKGRNRSMNKALRERIRDKYS